MKRSGQVTIVDFFRPKPSKLVKKYERAIREAGVRVDPAILADQLGLQIRTIELIQRKLGLRKCRASNPKGIFD